MSIALPRYVILQHSPTPGKKLPRDAPEHFDWMFELGETLATWATDELSVLDRDVTMPATKLANHRKEYLDYQGELSGGRGVVARIESGQFELLEQSDECSRFRLIGVRSGVIEFQRTRADLDGGWQLSFRCDRDDAS